MTTNLYAFLEARPDHPNFGEPFYIGIGTPKRPRTHLRDARSETGHRNWRFQEVLAGHLALKIEPTITVLATFATRGEAGEAERAAIARYGRIGIDPTGILTNLAAGGEGPDATLMQMPEIRQRNSDAQKRRSPESRARSDAALQRNRDDPEIEARRRENSRQPSIETWAHPDIRARRTGGMAGKKKTMTPEAIAARQTNAGVPKTPEALAAMKAAVDRNWADPDFRAKRSRNQAAAWDDPEKRANMLTGRSEGIAKSWDDPAVRARRSAGVAQAVAAKWSDDPEYAERARAGLRAAWADPEKKAARIAKMRESRKQRGAAVQTATGIANRSAAMTALNAARSTEERSARQTESWNDPTIRERRAAGLAAAAQDPELKAQRIANMLAGKRRKAAARAAENGETADHQPMEVLPTKLICG